MSQSPNGNEAQSPRSPIAQSHFSHDNYDDDNNTTTSSNRETLPRRGHYRLQSADMDIHQLRFENDGLYGQNDHLQENIKKLEGEVKILKSNLSNANAHTEQGNTAYARLERAHNLLQAANSKLQETHKTELDDLMHRYSSLAGSVSGTDRAKGRIETALAETKNLLKVSPSNFRAIEYPFHPHHFLDTYRWTTLWLFMLSFDHTMYFLVRYLVQHPYLNAGPALHALYLKHPSLLR